MREQLRVHFDNNRDILAREIDCSEDFQNRLLKQGVITDDHLEEIQSQTTTLRKNGKLIDILKKQDDKYYEIFRKELGKRQPQLVEKYLPEDPMVAETETHVKMPLECSDDQQQGKNSPVRVRQCVATQPMDTNQYDQLDLL